MPSNYVMMLNVRCNENMRYDVTGASWRARVYLITFAFLCVPSNIGEKSVSSSHAHV